MAELLKTHSLTVNSLTQTKFNRNSFSSSSEGACEERITEHVAFPTHILHGLGRREVGWGWVGCDAHIIRALC